MAAPASAAPIAASAISAAVTGRCGDMLGVWIPPVTAQVMMTFRASAMPFSLVCAAAWHAAVVVRPDCDVRAMLLVVNRSLMRGFPALGVIAGMFCVGDAGKGADPRRSHGKGAPAHGRDAARTRAAVEQEHRLSTARGALQAGVCPPGRDRAQLHADHQD